MVWYDLRVGTFKAKITPVKKKEVDYQDVDNDGNPVKRISGSYTKGHFEKQDGTAIDRAFKFINNKVVDKLQKTKEIRIYKEVDRAEVNNLISESYYYVECDELKRQLQDTGKALKFAYTNGNGYKCYIAYITLFGNVLVMYCGLGYLSEQILEIDSGLQAQKLLDELKEVNNVERLNAEQMIVI